MQMNNSPEVNSIKPFLRWAGGKTWLIKHLDQILLGKDFNNYHEPFLGGGAIYFALNLPKQAFLSDLNADLVNVYLTIKDNPYAVISTLKEYRNTKEFYYELRGKKIDNAVHQAAKFIFLNQTSYNGLYRVNRQGEYNVPYGYRTKNFLEEEKLLQISIRLQSATIECNDFMCTKANISEGDLVFLDPPYTVSHNNNGFIKYNQKLFSLEDQKRLSQLIDYIKSIGAFYVLTNAAHDTILEIFDKGDRWIKLDRASLIGGENAKRGRTSEYIFTNISKEG
jgi:DNA adenine methylase